MCTYNSKHKKDYLKQTTYTKPMKKIKIYINFQQHQLNKKTDTKESQQKKL